MSIEFVLSERYRLLSPLGEGGMASVYMAQDETLGRRVAVKVLSDALLRDPSFIKRFHAEAEAAASLSHPNIVSVFDVGQDGNRHFIVMELVTGRNLKDIILDRAPLTSHQAVALTSQVLEGLAYAHVHGLVHRDIKPHNILVTRENVAKLADFGIAKAIDGSSATQTAAVLGSAHYLSPEQALGEPVSPQSDLYSVAVVLYEMCTGQVPFDGSNLLAVASRHINDQPEHPAALNAEIPGDLSRVILIGMSKDPSDRFESADAMRAALHAFDLSSGAGADLDVTQLASNLDIDLEPSLPRAQTQPRSDVILTRPSVLRFGFWAVILAVMAGLIKSSDPLFGSSLPVWVNRVSPIGAAAIAAIAILVIGFGLIERLRCRYVIDRHAVTVEIGILGHHRDAIPLPAIVNLQLHQSPFSRMFDAGTIVLTTVQVPGQGPVTLHLRDVAHASSVYDTILQRIGGGRGPSFGLSDFEGTST